MRSGHNKKLSLTTSLHSKCCQHTGCLLVLLQLLNTRLQLPLVSSFLALVALVLCVWVGRGEAGGVEGRAGAGTGRRLSGQVSRVPRRAGRGEEGGKRGGGGRRGEDEAGEGERASKQPRVSPPARAAGKCKHNRQRSKSKDCGGASICEHSRVRCRCKDFGGASICEHNRVRSKCKDCGGASICAHRRERSKCKDCKRRLVRSSLALSSSPRSTQHTGAAVRPAAGLACIRRVSPREHSAHGRMQQRARTHTLYNCDTRLKMFTFATSHTHKTANTRTRSDTHAHRQTDGIMWHMHAPSASHSQESC